MNTGILAMAGQEICKIVKSEDASRRVVYSLPQDTPLRTPYAYIFPTPLKGVSNM